MYRYKSNQQTRRVRAAIDWDEIYEGGVCPDCEESIPKDTLQGGECENCGHVFWSEEEYTREQALPRESSRSARRVRANIRRRIWDKVEEAIRDIKKAWEELDLDYLMSHGVISQEDVDDLNEELAKEELQRKFPDIW